MADNVPGQAAFGLSLKFTPASGQHQTEIPIEGILSVTPPVLDADEIKFTPISGDLAGKEQVVAGKIPVQQSTVKCVYEATRHTLLTAIHRTQGEFVLTLADGSTMTGTGCLKRIAVQELNDANEMTSELVFSIAGDWTYAQSA